MITQLIEIGDKVEIPPKHEFKHGNISFEADLKQEVKSLLGYEKDYLLVQHISNDNSGACFLVTDDERKQRMFAMAEHIVLREKFSIKSGTVVKLRGVKDSPLMCVREVIGDDVTVDFFVNGYPVTMTYKKPMLISELYGRI